MGELTRALICVNISNATKRYCTSFLREWQAVGVRCFISFDHHTHTPKKKGGGCCERHFFFPNPVFPKRENHQQMIPDWVEPSLPSYPRAKVTPIFPIPMVPSPSGLWSCWPSLLTHLPSGSPTSHGTPDRSIYLQMIFHCQVSLPEVRGPSVQVATSTPIVQFKFPYLPVQHASTRLKI